MHFHRRRSSAPSTLRRSAGAAIAVTTRGSAMTLAAAAMLAAVACVGPRGPSASSVRACAREDDVEARCHLFCRPDGTCVDYDVARPVVDVRGADGAPLRHASYVGTSAADKLDVGRLAAVDTVVVHTTEVLLTESGRTLFDDAGKSVHFMVDDRGRIYQFASAMDTAWHAGNRVVNARSIGIEHVACSLAQGCEDDARRTGAAAPYTSAMVDASAALVRGLSRRFPAIVMDRAHIIGHDQVANRTRIDEASPPCEASVVDCERDLDYGGASHHVDPGVTWDWCAYMSALGGTCRDDLDACPRRDGAWQCGANLETEDVLQGTAAFRCVPAQRIERGMPATRWIAERRSCRVPCAAGSLNTCRP